MTIRIRTTISLTPEAHAIFKRMANAANMSTSRAMGEWLSDTSDAAEMIVLKMEDAKKAPMRVMREMQAMIAGMNDQVKADIVKVRRKGSGAAGLVHASQTLSSPLGAPSSNTGLKSPTASKTTGPKS